MPVYNRGFTLAARADLEGSTWRVMLVTTGYTFNMDHNFVNANTSSGSAGEPGQYEITGASGYARQNLALTEFEDDTNDFAGLDAADTTFGALGAGATIGGHVIYRYSTSGGTTGGGQTTGDSGQELLAYQSYTATPTNGGAIGITWPSTSAGGVVKVGSTS